MHIPSTYNIFKAYGVTYLKNRGAKSYTLAYEESDDKLPRFYSYSYDTRSTTHSGSWRQIDRQTFTTLLYKTFKLI